MKVMSFSIVTFMDILVRRIFFCIFINKNRFGCNNENALVKKYLDILLNSQLNNYLNYNSCKY